MPRQARIHQLSSEESRCYHVICRVTKGQFWLKDKRMKEVLRKQLWQVSRFCGVEILGYCWMDNHIHLLLRVPPARDLSDGELLKHCKALYGPDSSRVNRIEMALRQNDNDAEVLRKQLLLRMHDLSSFVKEWKQRFAIWHNGAYRTFGTLWSGRFKSLVVQDEPHVLRSVSAYIHLNPVRAGIVGKPRDFSFSLYGEFCQSSANGHAKEAFCRLMHTELSDFTRAEKRYQSYLKNLDSNIGDEFALALKRSRSRRSQDPLRATPLSQGVAIGTKDFVSRWL